MLGATGLSAHAAVIPEFYQGAWSTHLEYCGNDSDGNFFIGKNDIAAWEVSWDVHQITQQTDARLVIDTVHQEYENQFPVKLSLRKIDKNHIIIEECDKSYCWKADVFRCPR
jgi:hypothetical protein